MALTYRHWICSVLTLILAVSVSDTSEIDFSQIPNCTYPSCFPYHSSAIGCPSLTKSCFCNALEPINCAGKSCNGSNWYALEDWFDTQCGSSPTIDFSSLALCSRKCVLDNIVPAYCNTTITRNCFCRLQSEMEGFSPCVQNGCNVTADEAVYDITKFYNDTCVRPPSIDGSGASGSSTSQSSGDEVISVPNSDPTLNTPESRLNEIIGLSSGFGTLIGFVLTALCWMKRRRRKQKTGGRTRTSYLESSNSPPPRYTRY